MSRKPQPTSRQKGITMEDLKRQTAIRLAQEQKQHGRGNEETILMPQPQPPQQPPPPPSLVQNQGYPHNRVPQQGETHRDQYTGREVPPQHRPQYVPPPPQSFPQNQYNPHYHHQSQSYPNSQYRPTGGYYDDRGNAGMHNMRHQNIHQGREMMNNTAYGGGANRFPRNQPDAFNPNKLTHGLTVQELKQMTQARLQAEAAENVDNDRLSPLDFDSSLQDPPRERTESTNSIPSLVQVGQGSNGRQVQGSPGSRQNFNQEYGLLPPQPQHSWDGNVPQQHKMDSLDNASTNSFNNSVISDNLGSESAFSGGIGVLSQSDSDFSTGQFNRYAKENNGRSGMVTAAVSPATAKQSMFMFDAAVGGNRRRAATLSPNPGSILEDRPHFDQDVAIPLFDGQDLAIPSFASAGGASLLAARSRANSSSAVLPSDHVAGDDSLFGLADSGVFGFDDTPNRARTESAVSLPPMSHTGDEFGMDSILSQQMVSQGREGPAVGHNSASSFGDNRRLRAPPGFSDGFGFAAAGRSNSNRSTFTSSAVNELAEDMGSLFHFAEGSNNRERLNTYPQSAKQTPEYISEEFFSKDFGTFQY
ncbi:unnamed protein product [Cylindrotheca closterium]|uniref:Uncharacterized protein n=1 Tax=Cylindrotheca closterium TaxID=2856 RepID=A0AAD2CBQ5_9STRA|nr:unnamed protein product [Cylindrotheca closterium]